MPDPDGVEAVVAEAFAMHAQAGPVVVVSRPLGEGGSPLPLSLEQKGYGGGGKDVAGNPMPHLKNTKLQDDKASACRPFVFFSKMPMNGDSSARKGFSMHEDLIKT